MTIETRVINRDEASQVLPGSPDVRQIVHPSAGPWLTFRSALSPRYWMVWRDLITCMLMIAGGFAAHLAVTSLRGNLFGFQVGVLFALWIGFWLNALLTFGHEAAHYNLTSDRKRNDLLADWTIWLFFAKSTKDYRKSHWQHHLHLGDFADTEISYHNCLSPWFLAKLGTGLYLITLASRYLVRSGHPRPAQTSDRVRGFGPLATIGAKLGKLVPILRTLITHTIFIGAALVLRCYASAAVWLVGVMFVFPLCASVRQILEHRSAEADCMTDYQHVPHGPVNRTFGTDIFSRYFGAAGFNRHLLHHWDPTVSYTRFDDMQCFLSGTSLGPRLASARSSYFSTLVRLLRNGRNGGT